MRLFLSLFLLFILSPLNLKAGGDLPFPIEDGFLVHVTRHMMTKSTTIPGGAIDDKLTDRNKAPEVRCTFHNTFHGMVPDDAMSTGTSFAGFPIHVASQSNQRRRYAYLDRLSQFDGHVFGGQLNDIYTGGHHYGKGSIVVIPEEERELFLKANPEFSGCIETYKEGDNFRSVINHILLRESSCLLDYTKNTDLASVNSISDFIVKNGEEVLALDPFVAYFQKHKYYIGDHNYSPFNHYEAVVHTLCTPFHRCVEENPVIWKSLLPSSHIQLLLSLYPFVREELLSASVHVESGLQQTLRSWLVENESFLDFFRTELGLRKQNKSLFFENPQLREHIAARRTITVQSAAEALKELTDEQMKMIEGTGRTGDNVFVPAYISSLVSFDPSFPRRLTEGCGLTEDQRVAYQLLSLFKLYNKKGVVDPGFHDEMANALSRFAVFKKRPSEKFMKYVQNEFWRVFEKDESPNCEKVLSLLNQSFSGNSLQDVLFPNIPREELDLQRLLVLSPLFEYVWGENATLHTQLIPFLKAPFRELPVTCLLQAQTYSQIFLSRAIELFQAPLSCVHFCGDLVDTYLSQNLPTRKFVPAEKGCMISQVSLICNWNPDVMAMISKQDSEENNTRSQLIDALLLKGSELDKFLTLCVKGMQAIEATLSNPLSPQHLLHLLSKQEVNLLALIRGGCFGGLKSVISACGYGAEFDLFYENDEISPWYHPGRILPATFASIIETLKSVRLYGVDAAKERINTNDKDCVLM